jgi:hypothetical protein
MLNTGVGDLRAQPLASAAAVLQVPKSFNVWSLDALSDSDIINSIISLNMRPT